MNTTSSSPECLCSTSAASIIYSSNMLWSKAGRLRRRQAAVAAVAVLVLSGCTGTDAPGNPGASGAAVPGDVAGTNPVDLAESPSEHVHAVQINPTDDRVYLATHEGLFIAGPDGWTARGPDIDLMGFTVAGPDHFYASGHPGQGTGLPNPVGLIESRDGGTTWTTLSRGGQSDFHAMTATPGRIAAFDGQLRTSTDGAEWGAGRGLQAPAFSLAGGELGAILATTEVGLASSKDDGLTWSKVDDAPLMLLVSWATGETFVGIEPDGTIHVSFDSGQTWQDRGRVDGQLEALGATGSGDEIRIVVVSDGSVLESRDDGNTFHELRL